MRYVETVVIGGGQAGLAMSSNLVQRGIDHVVLERGQIGQRWRERWDSLKLLTPNWQTRLTGVPLRPAADEYMTKDDLVESLEALARSFACPVQEQTRVVSVQCTQGGEYRVITDREVWQAPSVVLATGYCDVARRPGFSRHLSPGTHQLTPDQYRSPLQLPPGGVLVVGGSATGTQLALELRRSGREVWLAVGKHSRMPRRYRGRDIMHWLDATGFMNERIDAVRDPRASRTAPSLQISGSDRDGTLDLNYLRSHGIRLLGSVVSARDGRVHCAQDLSENVDASQQKLQRVLNTIDEYIAETGIQAEPALPLEPIQVPLTPTTLELRSQGITSVLWAVGYSRDYSWLHVPVLGPDGELQHCQGITTSPGLYALGLVFMRRRNSSTVDGVGQDARELADHLADYLSGPTSKAA